MKICTHKPVYDAQKWIQRYLNHLEREEALSQNTMELYQSLFKRFLHFVELSGIGSIKQIDAHFISSFLLHLEEKYRENKGLEHFSYSSASRQLYVVVLKTLFDFIEENAEFEIDGSRFSFEYEFKSLTKKRRGRKGNKKKQKVKHLTYDEVQNLVHHLDLLIENRGRHYDYIYSLAVKLMLFGGLRVSEALGLTLEDIHLFTSNNGEEIAELTLTDTKSGAEQYVPIKKEHIKQELEYVFNLPNREDNYFISDRYGRATVHRTNLYNAVKKIYFDAGISKSGLHILRHTSAMMLLDKTSDITYVKELLRHSNINTTMIYVQRSTRQLGEKII